MNALATPDLDADTRDAALDAARELVRAGVPLFLAPPDLDKQGTWKPTGGTGGGGYWLPQRWQHTEADEAVVDDWRPGMALCAVMGHGLDAIDVDPRSGGEDSFNGLREAGLIPVYYAEADTVSGGKHLLVASLGVGSRDGIAAGVDVKAGTEDGEGRGFIYLAPTERLSKTTGEVSAYRWKRPPDLDRYAAERADDSTGNALADLVRAARSNGAPAAAGSLSGPSPLEDVSAALAEGRNVGTHRLAAALRGRGGWRVDDAVKYLEATVWPLIDHDQAGEPFPWAEFETTIRRAFARYPDGPEVPGLSWELVDEDAGSVGGRDEEDAPLAARMIGGGSFILDVPSAVPYVWGTGAEVLWSEGEALILAGPPGVGKTTLTGQVVRGLLGLGTDVLGHRVAPATGRVLYLAMDRPRQIARSLARHFRESEREVLDEGLRIWQGPPPADLAKQPGLIAALAAEAGASHVILDSLKDAALGLSEDEVGASYNRARQTALAAGVELLELHHTVKRGPHGARPTTLADLYGSAWIAAGAGSVVLLWGAAGDPIVELTHLKQPAEPVGPLRILHDHTNGVSTVSHGTDPLAVVNVAGAEGITAQRLAGAMFETDQPDRNETEKARRRLEKLRRDGLVEIHEVIDPRGGPARTAYRTPTHAPSGARTEHARTPPESDPPTHHTRTHDPHVYAGQALTQARTALTPPGTHDPPLAFRQGGSGAGAQEDLEDDSETPTEADRSTT